MRLRAVSAALIVATAVAVPAPAGARAVTGTRPGAISEPSPVPAPVAIPQLDRRCLTGRVLCIDKSTRTLELVRDGRVELRLAVRLGGDAHPTREGAFRVFWKDRRHVSSLYRGLPMPYSMFFSGGEAVHYSPEFARVGYVGYSHGCVETSDRAATRALFDRVRVGDRVIVFRSRRADHPKGNHDRLRHGRVDRSGEDQPSVRGPGRGTMVVPMIPEGPRPPSARPQV